MKGLRRATTSARLRRARLRTHTRTTHTHTSHRNLRRAPAMAIPWLNFLPFCTDVDPFLGKAQKSKWLCPLWPPWGGGAVFQVQTELKDRRTKQASQATKHLFFLSDLTPLCSTLLAAPAILAHTTLCHLPIPATPLPIPATPLIPKPLPPKPTHTSANSIRRPLPLPALSVLSLPCFPPPTTTDPDASVDEDPPSPDSTAGRSRTTSAVMLSRLPRRMLSLTMSSASVAR